MFPHCRYVLNEWQYQAPTTSQLPSKVVHHRNLQFIFLFYSSCEIWTGMKFSFSKLAGFTFSKRLWCMYVCSLCTYAVVVHWFNPSTLHFQMFFFLSEIRDCSKTKTLLTPSISALSYVLSTNTCLISVKIRVNLVKLLLHRYVR